MSRAILFFFVAALPSIAQAQNWTQWGATAQHHGAAGVAGRRLDRIEAEIVLDPFADAAEAAAGGNLLAHYPVPLIDGEDLFVVMKSGSFTDLQTRETQTWNVVNLRRTGGHLATRWTYASDWKPVPWGSPSWEPVYHPAVSGQFVWAPAAGGAIDKIRRADGIRVARFSPFGTAGAQTVFVTGPPAIDNSGNVYYNAMQLDFSFPWNSDPPNSWLVRIGADGATSTATFTSLTPNAPGANALCTTVFDASLLPWPPSRLAVAPSARCGPQRPGINVAPAVAPDGTVYTISRAHANSRWGFLIAANPDLTPKWSASLRNRLQDGCDVSLPPNGSRGGCRTDAIRGVDPSDNQPGSGAVNDNATSSPVVTPDKRILYGSYTRYNYSQGHLMMFSTDGRYLGAYGWGWDLTPAIFSHDGTYSIILKENHYAAGSYCNDPVHCPLDRGDTTSWDPEAYYITQLDSSLRAEWKFRGTNSQSCTRLADGTLDCLDDHPNGFEWCVNAVAVDSRGVVYANSEDGNLYAIAQGGRLEGRLFLRSALGAAYTPTSIGPDGRIYTQNDGRLFVIDQSAKRRSVRQK